MHPTSALCGVIALATPCVHAAKLAYRNCYLVRNAMTLLSGSSLGERGRTEALGDKDAPSTSLSKVDELQRTDSRR